MGSFALLAAAMIGLFALYILILVGVGALVGLGVGQVFMNFYQYRWWISGV